MALSQKKWCGTWYMHYGHLEYAVGRMSSVIILVRPVVQWKESVGCFCSRKQRSAAWWI